MNLHLGLKIMISFSVFFLALFANAQEVKNNPNESPMVEVHYPQDVLASYKERREDHGMYFSIGYEDLVLSKFISMIDSRTYKENFGSTGVALIRAGLEYKYNMQAGSLALGVEAGAGEVSGKDTTGDRKMSAMKYGATAKFVADMIFDEPYVAPYIGISGWQMSVEDKTTTTSLKESVNGYNYSLGLMIQLDWIDYNSAKHATFDYGLENTFIDVYATQYVSAGSGSDPDLSTDFILGANLRFEF